MFREIRKIKNELSLEEAKELLRKNPRGALSVLGDNGYPYAVPMNFFYDEQDNAIYFHSSKRGHKIDSILANDKVCFTSWDHGYLEEGDWAYHVSSVIVFGRVRLIDDPKVTEEKVRIFAQKYYPSKEELELELKAALAGVQLLALEIDHISGKKVQEK